ncbi:McrC family protein [Hippea alviniae]|uniref:McrC family protein n=1 Tax=Hippea alviniae TaxID=1279027 RepID=UPI0003B46993|nr:McrC family protein [Hippea alviniae]
MKNQQLKTVIEYEEIKPSEIGDPFKELEEFAKQNPTVLSFTRNGNLKSQNYVGIIQTKLGFVLEILPKISDEEDKDKSKAVLLRMLKTLRDSPFRNYQMANLKIEKLPIFEIFIKMFLDELGILIRKGIKNDYVLQEENLPYLKGKLKISEHIIKNLIHKEKFFVEYNEYMQNRVENQIIKTTLLFLQKKTKRFQKLIRKYLFVFDDVDEIYDVKSAFAKISLDRTIKYYENVLIFCKIFLLNRSFSPYKGDSVAFALLFDMNRLFEDYVGSYFKKHYKNVVLQHREYHLLRQGGEKFFNLRPDIYMEDENIILDTKWKIIKEEKDISQDDLYQMFTYAMRYNSHKVYLIYPKIQDLKIDDFEFCGTDNKKLYIRFFDVDGDFEREDLIRLN